METTEKKINIQKLFTDIAPTYDRLNHLLSFSIDRYWRYRAVKALKYNKSDQLDVLDLCAGTLDLTQSFLSRHPQAKMTSLDFSAAMLEHGRPKVEKKWPGQVEIICADAMNLPMQDPQYDVIVCGYGFRNLPDKKKGLDEMFRVLKPGGKVMILDFFRPTNAISMLFHKTYGNVILPLIGKWISKHPDAYQYLRDSIQNFYSLSECSTLMKDAGFSNVNAKNLAGGISSYLIAEKN